MITNYREHLDLDKKKKHSIRWGENIYYSGIEATR